MQTKNTPKKIAILRTAALGDVCMTIPLAICLRDQFPEASIHWIIQDTFAPMVEDIPGIQLEIIQKPKKLSDYLALHRRFKKQHFDALLLIQSSLRSNLLSLCIKAKRKIGYGALHSKDGQRFFVNQRVPCYKEHLVDSFMRFAEALGIEKPKVRWELPLPAHSLEEAKQLMPSNNKPLIALCTDTSKQERNWSVENNIELINQLQKKYGAQIILIGEPETHSKISPHTSQPCTAFKERLPLKTLCSVLSLCDCLVSPDTGPAHIATALNIPVIGLYAVMTSEKTGPYNSREHCIDVYKTALSTLLNKTPEHCSWNTRAHHPEVMSLITPQKVMVKIQDVL